MQQIVIEKSGRAGASGQRYNAIWNGMVIVALSKDPEFDCCRELLSRGVTGKLVTRHAGSEIVSMTIDIEYGATLAAGEGQATGPRLRKWTPHPHADVSVAADGFGQEMPRSEIRSQPTEKTEMAA